MGHAMTWSSFQDFCASLDPRKYGKAVDVWSCGVPFQTEFSVHSAVVTQVCRIIRSMMK